MDSSTAPKSTTSDYQANLEILMGIPFLMGLPMEFLKVVAYLCKRGTYQPDEVIFREQEVDANAYYILSGKAALTLQQNEGDVLRELTENDFIGGLSLFVDSKRLFTMKASSRLTCIVLSGEKFRKTLEHFPDVTTKAFKIIVNNIHEWEAAFIKNHALGCTCCRSYLGVSLV